MGKKAQASIEFIVLSGFIIFFIIVFLVIIQSGVSSRINERNAEIYSELIFDVQDEINMAFKSSDGYRREFNLPQRIEGTDYNITIIGNSIYLKTDDKKFAMSVSTMPVTGNVAKGINVIKKEGGVIYLNYEQ
jgi:hypothetical protein